MICCSGNIESSLDTDALIYLVCDGTVYEASPAGSGAQPFTAYLPTQPNEFQIMFVRDGVPAISQGLPCN